MRRFACGLAVNVVPYRHQPPTFWREVLKLLMHSLGMPLIRDKAVHAFVERIQRTHDGAGTEKKKGPKGQQPKKAVAAKVAATVASLAGRYHPSICSTDDWDSSYLATSHAFLCTVHATSTP